MNEFQYEVDNKATTKNTNYTIFLIIGIVIVLLIYNFFPNNMKDKEAAYSIIVDKLCGSAISYSELKEIKKSIPGETVYVKVGELQSSFLVTNKDLIDPRLKGEEAKIPDKAYVRLSLNQKGDLFCEGLINNEDDINPPILNLKGSKEIVIVKGTNFIDPGAKSVDDYDGEVSSELQRSGTVNTNEVGEYEIKYISSDMAGNTSETSRIIKVENYDEIEETKAKPVDTINPIIDIKGLNPYCVELGTTYIEPGVEAKDNVDGNISEKIIVDSKIKENISGTYRVIYWVTDVSGNKATAYRSVIVKDSCQPKKEELPTKISNEEYGETTKRINTKPQITLLGDTSITIKVGEEYSDLGAYASDKEDGDLTQKIRIDSTKVKNNKGGIYNVYYEVEDNQGLKGKAKRIVNVIDSNAISNVATFNKTPLDLRIKLGHEEKIEMLNAKDSFNNDLDVEITIEDSSGNKVDKIDFYKIGNYIIKYNATPKKGISQTVTRKIEIYDDLSPSLLAPSQIIEEVRSDKCEITEEYLYSKGLTTNDGNNKVMPKLVMANSTNNLCSIGEFNISLYSIDESNNKSEEKNIKVIIQEKNIVQDNVTNIEITNCPDGKIDLKTNSTYQLNAIVYPTEALNRKVSWSSSDSDIVSVINGNLSTSSVDGKVVIKVESEDGKKSNECEVKVEKQITEEKIHLVKSVEIIGCETGSLIIQKNTSKILSSKIKPENATNKNVSWNTNGTNLSISSNGELKGINIGESTIELKSEDGNKISLCKITVVEEPIYKDETAPSKVRILSSNVNKDPYNKDGIWYGGVGKREIKIVLESIEKESKIIKFIFLNKNGKIINEFYPLVNDNNKAEINWTKDINEEVSIISINSEGLKSEPSDLLVLKLDNTGPITTFTSWIENPEMWTKDTSIKVSYSSVDKLSGVVRYEYTHDDVKAKEAKDIKIEGTTKSIEMVFNESNISKYVYVRAVDTLGNIGPWTEKPSYLNMDSVAPKAPTIKILNNNTSKVTIGLGFVDSNSTKISGFGKFEYKLNNDSIKEITNEKETFDITGEGKYRVDAWSFDKAGNKSIPSYKDNIIVLSNKINNKIENNKYKITFDSDCGTTIESQTVIENNTLKRPANPTKEGYVFDNWYVNDIVFDFDTKIKEELILKARWIGNYSSLDDYVFEKPTQLTSKLKLKVLVIDIDPVLSKGSINGKNCTNLTASKCLNQNKDQAINELIEDIEYSSHNIIDVDIIKTEYLNEFPSSTSYTTLLNGQKSHKFDQDTWLDVMKDGWYGFWNDSRVKEFDAYSFDYNYIINKYNLITRRNNNEFNEVWILNVDPINTYESIMVGNNAYWINGQPIQANSKTFKIMNVSISRPDANFECFGHASENILAKVFDTTIYSYNYNYLSVDTSNYDNLNLFEKFILTEHSNSKKNTGLSGVGNLHFSPNSTTDYEWVGGLDNVKSKWKEWINYPNLSATPSSTVFNPTSAYSNYKNKTGTISDARTHHRWWFYLMPHLSGVTNDGFSNNWWEYLFDNNFVDNIELSKDSYYYNSGDIINDIVIYEKYHDEKKSNIITINKYINNISFTDKSILRINDNGQIIAYKKGTTSLKYFKDGKNKTIQITIN